MKHEAEEKQNKDSVGKVEPNLDQLTPKQREYVRERLADLLMLVFEADAPISKPKQKP